MAHLPLNTWGLCGAAHLKVHSRHGSGIHLAPQGLRINAGARRAALPRRRWRKRRTAAQFSPFDPAVLVAPLWTSRTMCGLVWSTMATYAAELELVTQDRREPPWTGYVCPLCATRAMHPALS